MARLPPRALDGTAWAALHRVWVSVCHRPLCCVDVFFPTGFLWAGKVKAFELRKKTKEELQSELEGLKNELAQLRVAKVSGGPASKLAKMYATRVFLFLGERWPLWTPRPAGRAPSAAWSPCSCVCGPCVFLSSKVIRKSIARVLTVYNQTQKVRWGRVQGQCWWVRGRLLRVVDHSANVPRAVP